jgi:hypothetical protein
MSVSRKKKAKTSDMFGPKPLPPHFGEIDVGAPFDPRRYFTMLRCVGGNPYLSRLCGDARAAYSHGFHGEGKLNKRRFYEAHAWANAQDRDHTIMNSYFRDIVQTKPDGDFVHYLG